MTWQIPWVIAGVDEVPLSIARTMAYVTTSGREGVVASSHLLVTANTTPNGAVNVATGVFVANNKFNNAAFESYVGRNESTSVSVTVPSTGGTSRTDLVYAHITDPGQSGHYPSEPTLAAPVETRVITNVSPTITSVQQHPGYEHQSGIALARITRPANTTTVQTSHITDLRVLLEAATSPLGQVSMYAGTTQPFGWLFCSGQAVARTTYAALFNTIGTTYGAGDGVNTFNLPDFRGRGPLGAGTGDAAGATAHSVGQKKGEQTHVISGTELPTHSHGMDSAGSHTHLAITDVAGAHTHTQTQPQSRVVTGGGAATISDFSFTNVSTGSAGAHQHGVAMDPAGAHTHGIQNAGSSAAMSLLQPSTVVNFIIKAY